jgi:sulfur carrier protein ThiS adenylyltransferase
MKIVAVTGPSGSGKTHLIRALIREAKSRGLKIAVVKHCAHGFDLDPKGKDSRLFTEAGADRVALVSPDRVAIIDNDPGKTGLGALSEGLHPRADIVLVEGGRAVPGLKRIEVLAAGRKTVAPSPGLLAFIGKCVAGGKVPVFAPDQVSDILDFLLLNAAEARSEIVPKAGGRVGDTGENLKRAIFSAHDPEVLAIAGAGGLGSNAAVCLARAGVGRLIIADFDRVEPSNLNRQYFFIEQIGERKVRALRENLMRINPFSAYEIHDIKVTPSRVARLFGEADILIEAFDRAEAKQMLIETWLTRFPDKPVIAASGLAGYGKNSKIRTRRLGSLHICGDEESECAPNTSPMAPRVAAVAALQANLAVELLMKARKKHV